MPTVYRSLWTDSPLMCPPVCWTWHFYGCCTGAGLTRLCKLSICTYMWWPHRKSGPKKQWKYMGNMLMLHCHSVRISRHIWGRRTLVMLEVWWVFITKYTHHSRLVQLTWEMSQGRSWDLNQPKEMTTKLARKTNIPLPLVSQLKLDHGFNNDKTGWMLIPIRHLKAYNKDLIRYDLSYLLVQTVLTKLQCPCQSQHWVWKVLCHWKQSSSFFVPMPRQLQPQGHFIRFHARIFPWSCMQFLISRYKCWLVFG